MKAKVNNIKDLFNVINSVADKELLILTGTHGLALIREEMDKTQKFELLDVHRTDIFQIGDNRVKVVYDRNQDNPIMNRMMDERGGVAESYVYNIYTE